jgi:hypothetical protein
MAGTIQAPMAGTIQASGGRPAPNPDVASRAQPLTPPAPDSVGGGDLDGPTPNSQNRGAGRATAVGFGDHPEVAVLSGEVTVEPFASLVEVGLLLGEMNRMGQGTVMHLRKAVHKTLLATQPEAAARLGMYKPDGRDPEAMVEAAPEVFMGGKDALPVGDHPLLPDEMEVHHIKCCDRCSRAGYVVPGCYFTRVKATLVNGWRPPVDRERIVDQYQVEGNYKGVDLYGDSAAKEFGKMTDKGAARVVKVPRGKTPRDMGIVSPLGAVLKGGDKAKAKTLCGVTITDQVTLSAANLKLEEMGMAQIKVRLSHDLSATGVNAASPKKPFASPRMEMALALVERGCVMCKIDIARYYHGLPIAMESRGLFLCIFQGVLYEIVRCTFGYRLCPYYASTISAEFGMWIAAYGIPVAWMMDDWFTVGENTEKALENREAIRGIIHSTGFRTGAEKDDIGQQLVWLGVMINSITMRLSFEPVVAKAFHAELLTYVQQMEVGGHIPRSTCARVAGKMEWYSQVLLEGKMHNSAWHHYGVHGEALSPYGRAQVLAQSAFWLRKLDSWARGEQTTEVPILSATELREDPSKLHIMQSDASGPDGTGYYHGSLADTDYQYRATAWDGDGWVFENSHIGELRGPLDFVRQTELRDIVLVCVMDCLSAAHSINKGICKEGGGRAVLGEFLRLCDEKGIQPLALWVPRERNQCADFLSHLATSLHRQEVSGRLSDLAGDAATGGGQAEEAQLSTGPGADEEVRGALRPIPTASVPTDVRIGGLVPSGVREEKQRVHQVASQREEPSEDHGHEEGSGVAEHLGGGTADGSGGGTATRGSWGNGPEVGPHHGSHCTHAGPARLKRRGRPTRSHSHRGGPRWTAARRRAMFGPV